MRAHGWCEDCGRIVRLRVNAWGTGVCDDCEERAEEARRRDRARGRAGDGDSDKIYPFD